MTKLNEVAYHCSSVISLRDALSAFYAIVNDHRPRIPWTFHKSVQNGCRERKVGTAGSRYRKRSSFTRRLRYHAIAADKSVVNTNDWRDRNPFARARSNRGKRRHDELLSYMSRAYRVASKNTDCFASRLSRTNEARSKKEKERETIVAREKRRGSSGRYWNNMVCRWKRTCGNYWNRNAPKCGWKPVRAGKIAKVTPKIIVCEISTFYVLSLDTATCNQGVPRCCCITLLFAREIFIFVRWKIKNDLWERFV